MIFSIWVVQAVVTFSATVFIPSWRVIQRDGSIDCCCCVALSIDWPAVVLLSCCWCDPVLPAHIVDILQRGERTVECGVWWLCIDCRLILLSGNWKLQVFRWSKHTRWCVEVVEEIKKASIQDVLSDGRAATFPSAPSCLLTSANVCIRRKGRCP